MDQFRCKRKESLTWVTVLRSQRSDEGKRSQMKECYVREAIVSEVIGYTKVKSHRKQNLTRGVIALCHTGQVRSKVRGRNVVKEEPYLGGVKCHRKQNFT